MTAKIGHVAKCHAGLLFHDTRRQHSIRDNEKNRSNITNQRVKLICMGAAITTNHRDIIFGSTYKNAFSVIMHTMQEEEEETKSLEATPLFVFFIAGR
jgi:hypothetical protein